MPLSEKSEGVTTIVTDKGTIEIADGQTTGTLVIASNNKGDVYVDASELTATISSASGGNFEQINIGNATATSKVTDTKTPVTVDLTASIVNEDASDTSYVFTATLSEKSEGVTTIVTDKGTIEIADGQTTGTLVIASNNKGDVYVDASELTATISSASGGNFEKINIGNATATAKVTDTPIDVTITATVTTPKIIDVNTKTDGTTGVKVTGYNSDGKETNLSIIKGTNHDGFGVDGKNLSNGDTKELGLKEKIVVEFTNDKDVNSLDVSFAWRNNHETAKLTFVKDTKVVGFATVDGDGSSTTKAIVKYYDENNNLIKEVNAKGSSDKVDEAFTFELPDTNGGIVSFDKVEFTAPQNKDDYLINKIVYKEVLDPTVTDIVTNGGNVTFNIQVDENYPPQGKATAVVEINNIKYDVVLNATGRGTLTLDSSKLGTDLSNVEVKVLEVKGGNYEKVNPTEASFPFTPTVNTPTSTDDTISTDEDVSYTLKVTDFGEVSSNTKEFKITELPTPEIGKLFLNITKGETIFNPDGTKTVATQDSKDEITKDQIVTLGQVGAGKVEFVPKENSDVDGSFKFQVGDGNGKFSTEYTTTIDVKAVADAPTVSIDVTKIEISQGDEPKGNDKILNHGSKKTIDFEGVSNKVSINVDLKGNGNTSGKINFYSNGILIASQSLIDGNHEYELEAGKYFDKFELEHTGTSNGSNNASNNSILEKYDLNGQPLSSFGTNGVLNLTFNLNYAGQVIIDSNNKIVFSNLTNEIRRINADGTLDNSFNFSFPSFNTWIFNRHGWKKNV